MNRNRSILLLSLSMAIFSTIGIVRRYLPIPSGFVAFSRGVIGVAAMVLVLLIRREKNDKVLLRRKMPMLVLSGVCIGANWVFLFEAYNRTSLATATVCYYMAPVFATLCAVLFFRDRLSVLQWCCVAFSCMGMVLVSGVGSGDVGFAGILYALAAACCYAAIILMNRFLSDVAPCMKTVIQLGAAAVAVGIYSFGVEDIGAVTFDAQTVFLLILMGVLHTGTAYALYFTAVGELSTKTVALFSYIDPALSILLSCWILREPMTWTTAIGILMIFGGTIVSELCPDFKVTLRKKHNNSAGTRK